MTIGIAWVGKRKDGRTHLYMASDSRTRGGMVMDCCPKILTLPRSDCAISFAGNTAATYPLMLQCANAISAHLPARDRSLDICTLMSHVLRVFTDIVNDIKDASCPVEPSDVQFIFAGYSWLAKSFKIWLVRYVEKGKRFEARPAQSIHPLLEQIVFVGDVAKEARTALILKLNHYEKAGLPPKFELEPFKVLCKMLNDADDRSTIGGPPQLVKIGEHMNARKLALKFPSSGDCITLMGRKLFSYENVDNQILDVETLNYLRPRSFGNRE